MTFLWIKVILFDFLNNLFWRNGHFNPFFSTNCHFYAKTIPNLVKMTSNFKVSHKANFLDMTLKFLTEYFECILIVK